MMFSLRNRSHSAQSQWFATKLMLSKSYCCWFATYGWSPIKNGRRFFSIQHSYQSLLIQRRVNPQCPHAQCTPISCRLHVWWTQH